MGHHTLSTCIDMLREREPLVCQSKMSNTCQMSSTFYLTQLLSTQSFQDAINTFVKHWQAISHFSFCAKISNYSLRCLGTSRALAAHRGPRFSSQYPHGSLKLLVISLLGNLMVSSGLY